MAKRPMLAVWLSSIFSEESTQEAGPDPARVHPAPPPAKCPEGHQSRCMHDGHHLEAKGGHYGAPERRSAPRSTLLGRISTRSMALNQ